MSTSSPTTGLVLAGAAALGAYEVGVLSYLVEDLRRDLGPVMPMVISGTSAGAINASALAAFADDPVGGMHQLARAWRDLRLDQILRASSIELVSMFLDLAGALRVRRALRWRWVRGGLLDPRPIAQLVLRNPIARISEHLAAGRLRGVAVSATSVATGTAVVFHQEARALPPWRSEANIIPIATTLTSEHVLASAAIPLLFPAVEIGGEMYCDGGLRQMVPLSPAIHLGADRLLVINPLPAIRPPPPGGRLEPAMTSPLYLTGKALNALFADRVDVDLARLKRTTAILRAGRQRFGPGFDREINAELARVGEHELRAVDAICIEPSVDLGALAADHISHRAFSSNAPGSAGRLLRQISDGDPRRAGDLLAYLLFDGRFSAALMDLGRADARARRDELCALFSPHAEPIRSITG